MKKINEENFDISEIESIELVGDVDTIDITVEDVHMFFANDIYTHNSAVNEDRVGVGHIADSYAKAAEVDLLISIARNEGLKGSGVANIGVIKSRLGSDGFYIDNVEFDTSRVFINFPKNSQEKKMIEDQIISSNFRQNQEAFDESKEIMDYTRNQKSK